MKKSRFTKLIAVTLALILAFSAFSSVTVGATSAYPITESENPIGVIFTGIFMAMLNIVGQNLTGFTAYNEYITDVIIAVIVYLSAFSLVIRMKLSGKSKAGKTNANAEPGKAEPKPASDAEPEKGGEDA